MKHDTNQIQKRLKSRLQWVIAGLLVLGPILDLQKIAKDLPIVVQTAFLVTLSVFLLRKMMQFRRWNDELAHIKKFVKALCFLLLVVVAENFATWATSATDMHKHLYVPLQDNVDIVLRWSFERSLLLKKFVLDWKVDMHWLLYCFVAMCLSVLGDEIPYSGFGIGARFMDTIAWTHALRTIAFMITVLPNPQAPNPRSCYAKNFPPVPKSWSEFIAIGFSAKRGSGCNDLVISGHGVVYTSVALAINEFYPLALAQFKRKGYSFHLPGFLAWMAVLRLCLEETVMKTHYSVDMFLAVTVTALMWQWRRHVYDPAVMAWRERKLGAQPDPIPKPLVAFVVGVLVLVFVGVKGV